VNGRPHHLLAVDMLQHSLCNPQLHDSRRLPSALCTRWPSASLHVGTMSSWQHPASRYLPGSKGGNVLHGLHHRKQLCPAPAASNRTPGSSQPRGFGRGRGLRAFFNKVMRDKHAAFEVETDGPKFVAAMLDFSDPVELLFRMSSQQVASPRQGPCKLHGRYTTITHSRACGCSLNRRISS
jgi:hypothetical protein